jgi:hypothetical protein
MTVPQGEDLIGAIVPIVFMGSTTITVSESLRAELVKCAAELQLKLGRKVDYEDVIHYLLDKSKRNAKLLKEACSPTSVRPSEFRSALRVARAEDRRREKRFEERYS